MPFWNKKPQQAVEIVPVEPEPEPEPVEVAPGVTLRGDTVSLSFDTVAQAKLAIRQLRLMKKELGIEKKDLTTQMSEIRAGRRSQVAQQGSMVRGGGGLGRAVRTGQRVGRDADRRKHVGALAPYEEAKSEIDRRVMMIDQIILSIDQMILDGELE